jgi:hypothetical protein
VAISDNYLPSMTNSVTGAVDFTRLLTGANAARGKPLFKASDGGQIDIFGGRKESPKVNLSTPRPEGRSLLKVHPYPLGSFMPRFSSSFRRKGRKFEYDWCACSSYDHLKITVKDTAGLDMMLFYERRGEIGGLVDLQYKFPAL